MAGGKATRELTSWRRRAGLIATALWVATASYPAGRL
jgi:hypothetical protein